MLAVKTRNLRLCLYRIKPKLHIQEHFPTPALFSGNSLGINLEIHLTLERYHTNLEIHLIYSLPVKLIEYLIFSLYLFLPV